MVNVRKFVCQGPHGRGAHRKIWPSLGAKFGDNLKFWKFSIKYFHGVYKSWKFERAILSGSGDI